MPTARNGDVALYYETFGTGPTLLLINGLGSQCINFDEQWCEKFAARGFRVIRYDNRDMGLSSKLDDVAYTLRDMAADALAVLDAAGAERAHVLGVSLGGAIVQRLAIEHGARLLSMTSMMSTTSEAEYGQSTPEALEVLMRKPARTRDEYAENQITAIGVYGSKREWIDEQYLRARAARAFDRCYNPAGVARQMVAVMSDGSRADELRALAVPTLVIHGDRDTLIDPSGGRRTAELIPGARYVEIEGMGHDYPAAVWDLLVDTWADFALSVTSPHRPGTRMLVRKLGADDIALVRAIDRSEHVDAQYRVVEGHLEQVPPVISEVPRWDPDRSGPHSVAAMIEFCSSVLERGGLLLGVFDDEAPVGLAIVHPTFEAQLAWLAVLHVTRSHRRRGAAQMLWDMAVDIAVAEGAEQIYVSATPTTSAVGFYLSQGCRLADPVHPELFAAEPDDIHLVCSLM